MNEMKEFFGTNKEKISSFLQSYLDERLKNYCDVNKSICEVISRIKNYSLNGKMIRGGLVLLGYNLFSKSLKKNKISEIDLIKVASAIEILHSSLLIHDDIMDRDEFRRGKESMHRQYFEMAKKNKMNDKEHFGESMAICAGDIGFFLCIELLSEVMEFDREMLGYFSREVVGVGMAQMQDVIFTHITKNPSESEIIEMYRHKTARYTFSMPLALGAKIAGADDDDVKKIEILGENLGIVFQIKDDEIGLFGDERVIGKPVFSDVKEGKKTIYNVALLDHLKNDERTYFEKKLASHYISIADIDRIKKYFEETGVRKDIANKMRLYGDEAKKHINSLECDDSFKGILLQLYDYSLNREK